MNFKIRALALSALSAGLYLIMMGFAGAQPLTTLHIFSTTDFSTGTNSDGANPAVTVILSGDTLYGTTQFGGATGNGAIFRVNTNGTGFTNLHSFAYADYDSNGNQTNADGTYPQGMILSGNTLYGIATSGGTAASGTVFKIHTDGTGFAVLHTFTATDPTTFENTDGAFPTGTLALGGGTLYGTAGGGGQGAGLDGSGTVFALSTNGGSVTRLVDFSDTYPYNYYGYNPYGVTLSGGTLYAVTKYGGHVSDYGTVFKINTNGTGFATLYSFSSAASGSNSDGAYPQSRVVVSGNMVYGVAYNGGNWDQGTVFAVDTNGTNFANLHSFSAISSNTNSDGSQPTGLIVSNSTLFGTANRGGGGGSGTVFEVSTNGSGFVTLHNFTPLTQIIVNGVLTDTNSDGAEPYGGVVLSGNNLYGTTFVGGNEGQGTVFAFTLPPSSPIPLNILLAGNSVVLSWSNSAFALQAAPSLTNVFTTISNAASPYTNPIGGAQQFFRLIAP